MMPEVNCVGGTITSQCCRRGDVERNWDGRWIVLKLSCNLAVLFSEEASLEVNDIPVNFRWSCSSDFYTLLFILKSIYVFRCYCFLAHAFKLNVPSTPHF